MPHDTRQAEDGDGHEPQQHDRPEDPADAGRAARLRPEQGQQDNQRGGHGVGLERVGQDVDAFERAQDRDGRRDDAVAVDQRRPEQPHDHERERARPAARDGPARDQGHQGQDAAFAMVVGPHDEQAVFQRNREDEGPDDEGQQPHGDGKRRLSADRAHDGLVGIERAGSEIAEDDAEGRERGRGGRARVGARGAPSAGKDTALFMPEPPKALRHAHAPAHRRRSPPLPVRYRIRVARPVMQLGFPSPPGGPWEIDAPRGDASCAGGGPPVIAGAGLRHRP